MIAIVYMVACDSVSWLSSAMLVLNPRGISPFIRIRRMRSIFRVFVYLFVDIREWCFCTTSAAWRNNIYTFLTCMSFPFVMSQTFSTRKLSANNLKLLQSKNFLFRRYHFKKTMCVHSWEGRKRRKKWNKKEVKCIVVPWIYHVLFLVYLFLYLFHFL